MKKEKDEGLKPVTPEGMIEKLTIDINNAVGERNYHMQKADEMLAKINFINGKISAYREIGGIPTKTPTKTPQ